MAWHVIPNNRPIAAPFIPYNAANPIILGIWTDTKIIEPIKMNLVLSVPKNCEVKMVETVNGMVAILKIWMTGTASVNSGNKIGITIGDKIIASTQSPTEISIITFFKFALDSPRASFGNK